MPGYFWPVLGLVLLGTAACLGGRVWIDAGRRGVRPQTRLRWALRSLVDPLGYWWGARLALLPQTEAAALLARHTARLGLRRADGLRCPLCQAELPQVWRLASAGLVTLADRPIECPACDFRLDACRHCAHFQPGPPTGWGQTGWTAGDITFGRCRHYRSSQPVEQACGPDLSRQLRARGYAEIRGPLPIVDSFVPPDFCRAFRPDRQRLRAGGIRWPDRRRAGLLDLLARTEDGSAGPRVSSQPAHRRGSWEGELETQP